MRLKSLFIRVIERFTRKEPAVKTDLMRLTRRLERRKRERARNRRRIDCAIENFKRWHPVLEPEPKQSVEPEINLQAATAILPTPQPSSFDSLKLSTPSPAAIAAAAIVKTTPAAVAPEPAPEPKWWNELPPNLRGHLQLDPDAFPSVFLTDDGHAAERAWHYGQPCIAFQCWHDAYLQHPAIAGAERFWVYSTSGKFLKSLQNSPIRSRCVVLPTDLVGNAQWRRDLQRQRQDDSFFEKCLNCQKPGLRPIPAPPADITDLVAAPEPPTYEPQPPQVGYVEPWQLGGSAASR